MEWWEKIVIVGMLLFVVSLWIGWFWFVLQYGIGAQWPFSFVLLFITLVVIRAFRWMVSEERQKIPPVPTAGARTFV